MNWVLVFPLFFEDEHWTIERLLRGGVSHSCFEAVWCKLVFENIAARHQASHSFPHHFIFFFGEFFVPILLGLAAKFF